MCSFLYMVAIIIAIISNSWIYAPLVCLPGLLNTPRGERRDPPTTINERTNKRQYAALYMRRITPQTSRVERRHRQTQPPTHWGTHHVDWETNDSRRPRHIFSLESQRPNSKQKSLRSGNLTAAAPAAARPATRRGGTAAVQCSVFGSLQCSCKLPEPNHIRSLCREIR